MLLSDPAAIILDESPLSLLTAPPGTAQSLAVWTWYAGLEAAGCRFYVPEIADYELRRELTRAGKTASLQRLDEFNAAEADRYLPLTTPDVREAARLWAIARNRGQSAAPKEALDGDVLIAAQAQRLRPFAGATQILVATSNVSHISFHIRLPIGATSIFDQRDCDLNSPAFLEPGFVKRSRKR